MREGIADGLVRRIVPVRERRHTRPCGNEWRLSGRCYTLFGGYRQPAISGKVNFGGWKRWAVTYSHWQDALLW